MVVSLWYVGYGLFGFVGLVLVPGGRVVRFCGFGFGAWPTGCAVAGRSSRDISVFIEAFTALRMVPPPSSRSPSSQCAAGQGRTGKGLKSNPQR